MTPDVSLRDYIESIFREKEKAYEAQLRATKDSLELASTALATRLETMNEFRAQILEERAIYVRRDQLQPILDRLRMIEEKGTNFDGRFWALGIGLTIGLGIFTVAIDILLKMFLK